MYKLPVELTAAAENDVLRTSCAGPCLLVLNQVSETRRLGLQQPRHFQYTLNTYLFSEPGITIGNIEFDKSTFVDVKGKEYPGMHNKKNEMFQHRNIMNFGNSIHDQFSLSEALTGPLEWRADLHIKIPLKLTTKTIENLAAQEKHTIQTPEGAFTFEKPRKVDERWELNYTIPGQHALAKASFGSASVRGLGAAKGAEKPPENTVGLFVLNAAGGVIHSGSSSGHGDGTTMRYTVSYSEEPVKVLLRGEDDKTERTFKAVLKNIPVP